MGSTPHSIKALVPSRGHACIARSTRTLALAFLLGLGTLSLAVVPAGARGPGPETFADLAESVSDAVVNISATQTFEEKRATNVPQLEPGTPFDEMFEEFFRRHRQGENDQPAHPHERKSNSLGSGFIIDPAGIVITNNHVIADANEVTVILANGQKLKAEIVGKDAKVDVAVLRVKPDKPLKAVKFGDSDKMRVGDWVMAVGNPFGLGGSVTAGIISARNRNIESGPYDSFFQIDAAINKGNSGGPLFNMDGEVIGINTAILSPSGGWSGIGFANPSAAIMPVIDQLEKYGETRRGWLGVRIQNVDDSIAESLNLGKVRGALVAGTDEKGPAKAAGIQTGDVIVKFDGAEVKESRELPRMVATAPVGKNVDIVVVRQGKELTLSVKLGRLEDSEKAKKAALETDKNDQDKQLTETPVQKALGMEFSSLNEATRLKFAIKDSVTSGVVVSSVDPDSAAADKRIQPGEIIVEINQEPVKEPKEIGTKLKALKDGGKKLALLLIATPAGEVRFVAINLQ